MPPDVDTFEEDRILNLCEAVDTGVGSDDRADHVTTREDRTEADDAVVRLAAPSTITRLVEHELRGRQIGVIGSDWPDVVVHIEQRIDGDEVHVGVEVGVERSHIAPIGVGLSVFVQEEMCKDAVRVDDGRNDISAEIAGARRLRRVEAKLLKQKPGREDIDTHRRQTVIAVTRNRLRFVRFFVEANDPVFIIGLS